jgi:hypothetical protein
MGICCADHTAPYQQNSALTSPISGGRSVGKVLMRIKATVFVCLFDYSAMQLVESRPTFRTNMSPPSSGAKNKQETRIKQVSSKALLQSG